MNSAGIARLRLMFCTNHSQSFAVQSIQSPVYRPQQSQLKGQLELASGNDCL